LSIRNTLKDWIPNPLTSTSYKQELGEEGKVLEGVRGRVVDKGGEVDVRGEGEEKLWT